MVWQLLVIFQNSRVFCSCSSWRLQRKGLESRSELLIMCCILCEKFSRIGRACRTLIKILTQKTSNYSSLRRFISLERHHPQSIFQLQCNLSFHLYIPLCLILCYVICHIFSAAWAHFLTKRVKHQRPKRENMTPGLRNYAGTKHHFPKIILHNVRAQNPENILSKLRAKSVIVSQN